MTFFGFTPFVCGCHSLGYPKKKKRRKLAAGAKDTTLSAVLAQAMACLNFIEILGLKSLNPFYFVVIFGYCCFCHKKLLNCTDTSI